MEDGEKQLFHRGRCGSRRNPQKRLVGWHQVLYRLIAEAAEANEDCSALGGDEPEALTARRRDRGDGLRAEHAPLDRARGLSGKSARARLHGKGGKWRE